MDRIELSEHIKKGDTFYTPFTDPNGIGATLSLSSWSKCWLPEFLWIGLIIHELGRKRAFEKLYHIIVDLNKVDIAIPQMSKIFGLDKDKQNVFWVIVTQYVKKKYYYH